MMATTLLQVHDMYHLADRLFAKWFRNVDENPGGFIGLDPDAKKIDQKWSNCKLKIT